MSCKISKSIISGSITCPTNKSYSHRAVFIAALSEGKSTINNVLRSADTNSTIQACKNFGANIIEHDNSLEISNEIVNIKSANIDAANSGTTIRIATAIAALSDEKSTLTGDSSLQKRPMQPLLDALESMGAKSSSNQGCPPISISGTITGGEIEVPGNISSQFISALMIVSPLTQNGITLNITGNLVSKPYLDATIATMKKFGVKVQTISEYKKYQIANQKYKATNFTVPSDLSSLALLLSAAVLVGREFSIDVEIGDLPQGDKLFLDILEKLGIQVVINEKNIRVVSPEQLEGGKFDLGNTPDLLPPLSILSLKSNNPIEIVNVHHARFKETDRIKIICRELKKIGLKIEEKDDGMILEKSDKLISANFDSESDHRLFMAFCIVGMYVGGCTVSNPESVAVSYPNFISEMNRLGAQIDCTT
ncbi:MAG: 3-phosphoshikimate 1-carboxyvinyltransferase [Nitrosopumilaceae archaeon]|nr:3-phosphoshikimate 1-carboxyvinyltransferase [Nitrosopumilaceae archaeon]